MWFSNKDKFEYIISYIKHVIDNVYDFENFCRPYNITEDGEVYKKLENISDILGKNKTIAGVYSCIKQLNLGEF